MGRPRNSLREANHTEHELGNGATVNDHIHDVGQEAAGESDISNARLDSIARPADTVHSHGMSSDNGLSNSWDGIQDRNEDGHRQASVDQMDLSMNGGQNYLEDPVLDPEALATVQHVDRHVDLMGESCSCLNDLYSMLMSFKSWPSPSFPLSRGLLTRATNLARSVVHCPFCPRDYPSAVQNIMLLNTLLPLVTHGYAQLLAHIQERAALGIKITYRVGEASESTAHLHTYTPDCPMGFNLELDSDEWAAMARKVVKQDVYGSAQCIDCLLSVVEQLEERQHMWHFFQPFGSNTSCSGQPPNEGCDSKPRCLQLTSQTREAIDALNL